MLRVPFPFVEDNRRRYRPGLAVSNGLVGGSIGLVWVVMITGAGHEAWPDDVDVGPLHADFGLPIPSRIRVAKIAAVEPGQASLVGRMDASIVREVIERIGAILAPTAPRPPG